MKRPGGFEPGERTEAVPPRRQAPASAPGAPAAPSRAPAPAVPAPAPAVPAPAPLSAPLPGVSRDDAGLPRVDAGYPAFARDDADFAAFADTVPLPPPPVRQARLRSGLSAVGAAFAGWARWCWAGVAGRVRAAARIRLAVSRRRRSERREMRRFTASARRRRLNLLVAASAVLALVVTVAVGAFSPLMGLQTVEVVGASRLDVAAVSRALSSQKDVPLTLLDRSQIERELAQFPVIQEYAVELIPPHTMLVRVVERQPVLLVQTEGGFSLVDAAGVAIGVQPERAPGLPVLVGVTPDAASAAFGAIVDAVGALPAQLTARIDTITASSADAVSFSLPDAGVQVVWGSASDAGAKAMVLERLLAALAGQGIRFIDVSSVDAPVYS